MEIALQSSILTSSRSSFPESIELQLFQTFRSLKLLGCDYLYFLASNDESNYRFCTHEDWIDFYYDERFILNDPLKRIAESSKFVIMPWEQITQLYGNEKKTMNGRTSFGLFHGLTITIKSQQNKYIFALATESKDHDLARYCLLEKMNKIEISIQNFIKIFNQYLLLISKPISNLM